MGLMSPVMDSFWYIYISVGECINDSRKSLTKVAGTQSRLYRKGF